VRPVGAAFEFGVVLAGHQEWVVDALNADLPYDKFITLQLAGDLLPKTGSELTDQEQIIATAYHRTVIFECDATVSEDGEVLAAQQQRLMQHYQPDGGHTPVSTEHAMYRGAFKEIRALTLTVRARKVKWKLGQNRKPEQLQKLIGELRQRGRATDAAAADALQWSLDWNAAK